ncbi:hypothetical protein [Schlesneria paludicola]|uniref:hypothetical protein n=1 Tax=Schlesneria paludicola TaxID=360056 RepID=UPI00029A4B20|nr:hypothetical protein [Schlesneria paludicola]
MSVCIRLRIPEPREVQIDFEGGPITIVLRPLTLDDRLLKDGFLASLGYMHDEKSRMNATVNDLSRRLDCIKDWNGIEDETGKPVAFSMDNLKLFMAQNPKAIDPVYQAINEHYTRSPENVKPAPAPAPASEAPATQAV